MRYFACPVVVLGCTLAVGAWGEAGLSDPDWFEAGRAAVERARAEAERRRPTPAKNAIIFLGDGMDVTTVTAARIFAGQLAGKRGEEHRLVFEQLPHTALIRTYTTNMQVPDSAGTMTAILSGVKTRSGVLGVDASVRLGDYTSVAGSRVTSLCEQAEARGLSTGVVSTARLTHATPAACYAHAAHRNWEDDTELPEAAREGGFPDIARQLVEFPAGDGLEVALGGGRRHFRGAPDGSRKDGRDLEARWAEKSGAIVISDAEALRTLDSTETRHVLGLFADSHLEYEADRKDSEEPSLAEMTKAALAILSKNASGYVLIVEGGRIDHGHHAGNAYRALRDTIAFDEAVAAALEEVDLAETLIVVTADHGHTLSMGGYSPRGNPILGLVSGRDPFGEDTSGQPAPDLAGRPFTTLSYANGPGHTGPSNAQPAGPKHYPHYPSEGSAASERPPLAKESVVDPAYLQEAIVPLTSETHGGADVPLFADGPGAFLFHGVQEQNFIYHAIVDALGWSAND